MKYSFEMDKINAENNMNCSIKVLEKCLKVCGKAIHTTGSNDGRINIEETHVFFRVKIAIFGQFYAKDFHKKQIHYAKIVLHCE